MESNLGKKLLFPETRLAALRAEDIKGHIR